MGCLIIDFQTQTNCSSHLKNSLTDHQLTSIQVGKVSSAVKRLDSVLREQNSYERPEISGRPINSENYKENIPMTVSSSSIQLT